MCAVKKPSIPKPEEEKDLPILRNPILDGLLGNIAALRNGRNAFRIDLLNPLTIPVGGGPGGGGVGGGSGGGGGSTGGGSTGGGTTSTSTTTTGGNRTRTPTYSGSTVYQ